MLGDIVLMKLDAFQGKRKVKDQWSEAQYVVVRQVTDDIPVYDGRNVKVIHHNQLSLVATPKGDAMPLGGSESVSEEGAARSTLAELTPLEWESEAPESTRGSCVPLGWVDGILRPLPSVAP